MLRTKKNQTTDREQHARSNAVTAMSLNYFGENGRNHCT